MLTPHGRLREAVVQPGGVTNRVQRNVRQYEREDRHVRLVGVAFGYQFVRDS